MKAREWAGLVAAGDISEAFATETRELIAKRTAGSDKDTKCPAIEGALREQRMKWLAIARINPVLTSEAFDSMVDKYLADVKLEVENWHKKRKQKAEADTIVAPPKQEDVPAAPSPAKKKREKKNVAVYGRKLAESL